MDANFDSFLQTVHEIEANSWWDAHFKQHAANPAAFEYVIDAHGERITEVPSEPFESLLLRVRRLTMEKSAENLHAVWKAIKSKTTNPNVQCLLDSWHHHWRLAFIKEPYLLEGDGESQVMTAYRAYNAYINGRHFHSEPRYNIILYGTNKPANLGSGHLFIKNQFHWAVASLCMAALGLRLFITGGEEWILTGHVAGVTDFVWCRKQVPQMIEQYRIFNDWIQHNGGCSDCRW